MTGLTTRHPPSVLRSLYDWTLGLAGHRHALWALTAIAFIESSDFPIPPDILLIPMILAARDRAWRIDTVCTVASVDGGGAGYAIGYLLFDTQGRWLLELYVYTVLYDKFLTSNTNGRLWHAHTTGSPPLPP